jgi:hypothetical protein
VVVMILVGALWLWLVNRWRVGQVANLDGGTTGSPRFHHPRLPGD